MTETVIDQVVGRVVEFLDRLSNATELVNENEKLKAEVESRKHQLMKANADAEDARLRALRAEGDLEAARVDRDEWKSSSLKWQTETSEWAEKATNYKAALESCEKVLAITTQQRDAAGQQIREANDKARDAQNRKWEADRKLRERLDHEAKTGELAKLVEQACARIQIQLAAPKPGSAHLAVQPNFSGFSPGGVNPFWQSPAGPKSVEDLISKTLQPTVKTDG